MNGSPLERQISKTGTININQLNAYFNKASQIEKEVVNKVLNQQFARQKVIDYNKLKKAIQDELIGPYNRISQTKWADYGIDRLGFKESTIGKKTMEKFLQNHPEINGFVTEDGLGIIVKRNDGTGYVLGPRELEQLYPNWQNLPQYKTFTFESPRIPQGNARHYDYNTLGHSRTYTTPEEPKVLHIMESQSDWGQNKLNFSNYYTGTSSYLNNPENYRAFIDGHKRLLAKMRANPSDYQEGSIERQIANIEYHEAILRQMYEDFNPQIKYLHDNYLQRQLQENLKYAAENGQTKMRYPTPETAAKIEGYSTHRVPFKDGKQLDPQEFNYFNPDTRDFSKYKYPEGVQVKEIYRPEHETILKKYSSFHKQYKKLYKDAEVRTVTDSKGNTWFEVDVPKGYLSREWQFKKGGKI